VKRLARARRLLFRDEGHELTSGCRDRVENFLRRPVVRAAMPNDF
jgi:hypothetical protein